MSEELKVFIFFVIWLISAYLWSFSSWGVSVLWVGLMTAFWLSPQMASITYKLGKIGDVLGGLYHFHKSGNIPTRFLWIGSVVSITWSFLGTYFIFSLPDVLIYGVSALSMILLILTAIVQKSWLHTPSYISRKRERLYYACLFCVNIFGNFFIAGSWVWYYFINTFLIRLPALMAKWLSAAMSVFWFIGSFIAIMVQGQYIVSLAIAFGGGMFIGWWFGTKHIIKLGNEIFRNILLVSIIIFAFYFLYLAYNQLV